jgi:5-dehydro-2-deoxygluconokinase
VSGYDRIAIGRCGVDLYLEQTSRGLATVDTFTKSLGGSAANVTVATARHGRRAALISHTGADPLGDYVRDEPARYGVDNRWVTPVGTGQPTPLTLCEIFPPGTFPIYFYRGCAAPDLEVHRTELDLDEICAAQILWVTGTGLSAEPSRSAPLEALRERATGTPGAITILDLDYRPTLRPSPHHATQAVAEALQYATITVGNLEECAIAVGEKDPDADAEALLDRGVHTAVVKLGPHGVLARTGDETVRVAPVPVEVVNGLGAGDAFGGAFCHGLLSGWLTELVLRSAGAYVAARLACAPAMPTRLQVEELIGERSTR